MSLSLRLPPATLRWTLAIVAGITLTCLCLFCCLYFGGVFTSGIDVVSNKTDIRTNRPPESKKQESTAIEGDKKLLGVSKKTVRKTIGGIAIVAGTIWGLRRWSGSAPGLPPPAPIVENDALRARLAKLLERLRPVVMPVTAAGLAAAGTTAVAVKNQKSIWDLFRQILSHSVGNSMTTANPDFPTKSRSNLNPLPNGTISQPIEQPVVDGITTPSQPADPLGNATSLTCGPDCSCTRSNKGGVFLCDEYI